ncbi:MAG: FkbM family methyltransferase [Cytophagales bacterium]|nr:FkbM family methyltransferase [Cytophagales bacterium]
MGHRITFLKQRIFSAIRKKVLGKFAQGVIYNTSNGLLAAPIDDVSVGKSLGFRGAYDTPEIVTLQKLLSKEDVVYVIGTHIGALLIPLAGVSKEIIGYEANPETFEYVSTNILLNKLGNVRLFNFAVGDTARNIQFYQNRSNSGGSKIKPVTDKYYYTYDSPKTIEVPMVSLDQHISKNQLPIADGIVMDIEGAEYFALKGMPATLAAARFLYIEYVPHHLENVSGVSNKEFFDLILPHFSAVQFMRHYDGPIDLKQNGKGFAQLVDTLRQQEHADDLLFLKDT